MDRSDSTKGLRELQAVRRESAGLVLATVLFSIMVNMLTLTGPLYMLQVYDRVLGSGSEATLIALSLLAAGLFLGMGILDYVRGRVMGIVGARFQERLDRRVFTAAMHRSALMPNDIVGLAAQRDLEAVRSFIASPVALALMDLPWTPFFVAAVFVFHPLLGWLAIGGGAVLVVLTALNQVMSRGPQREAGIASVRSERMADQMKAEAEALQALGMSASGFDRWQIARRLTLTKAVEAATVSGAFGSVLKTFRMFLQSAMLGVGAWLVLQAELTGGAMIAGSILMGKALAPIEVAIGQWALAQRAHEGWRRLSDLLSQEQPTRHHTTLPRPKARLEVEGITVGPPGQHIALLQRITFRLDPGHAVGVIGTSGSGKSTLAKALTGVWHPLAGAIRLDGATLDQYDPDVLGRLVGYVPQRITLFDGTIAENIARLDPTADSDLIVAAAQKADAHDMIVKLPDGYDTWVSAAGGRLSGGQLQRIGLARALYGDPVVLILDEPTSNLDAAGSAALNTAIRKMKAEGNAVLIMAHRPAALLECDLLLVLEEGKLRAFGPRDQVLHAHVENFHSIVQPIAARAAE